jgi:3'-phosphoadenosine 5'-phosphosulfate (PAPS) 3'-phosphatase
MPIKPPNLDDRRYADILDEAKALIPQYCPEWTNLGEADPGMTLVQLFSWMTELTIYRLNRVPDKTYVHFLNFIGEERKRARPAVAPLTFHAMGRPVVEVPPFASCSTRQREDTPALTFQTTEALTVHDAEVVRLMAVKGGARPVVRELPFGHHADHPSALRLGGGQGIQLFEMDETAFGPNAYTPNQYLYISHDDFRLMDRDPDAGAAGHLRIRQEGTDALSIVSFFHWEYPTDQGWMPVEIIEEQESNLGMAEGALVTALPGIIPAPFTLPGAQFTMPEAIAEAQWWLRGRLDYERWLAARMLDDLEVAWKDDRGGEERAIHNWQVRASGRTLEFFLQDLPPIKVGWTIRMTMTDRGVPAGQNSYLPGYRWSYRRGDQWEEIPAECVRIEGTMILITGPLPDMAADGFNMRAERVETVFLRGICPELEVDLTWQRMVELSTLAGEDSGRAATIDLGEGAVSPFQITPILPPTIGRKFFIGSDLFENRRQSPVLMELEVGFEMNGEPIEEPDKKYHLQLTYRAEDSWRVVHSKDQRFAKFTFSDLDPDGAKKEGRRRIRINLNPKTMLKGLARHTVGEVETTWLRLELVKSNLSGRDENKEQHPIALKIYGVQLGADKTLGDDTYEQPLPGPKMVQLDHRDQNLRLTRVLTRATGRLAEHFPFFPHVEIEEENQALYLEFDRPLPAGARHAIQFRCRGETFLPAGLAMEWEFLEKDGRGRPAWRRLPAFQDGDEGATRPRYDLARSGVLEFPLPDPPDVSDAGFWLRGRFTLPKGADLSSIPSLPPVTHIMLNTVDAANLHTMRTERYSGHGVPGQSIQLLRSPVYLHTGGDEIAVFPRPELFSDIRLHVDADGAREEWTVAEGNSLLTCGKDDRVFVVDPVDGTLTFGNGIRGRMLPVGSNNVVVDSYHVVPGERGNVGPGTVVVNDTLGDAASVVNLLPSAGGRDAETIDEITRRAPGILTNRDRAVTTSDFEIIAWESSGEVARAACGGQMDGDGKVEVVVLPKRRPGEVIPDPFLAEGLRDHVSRYLKKRCLINVDPVVRLARFMPLDLNISMRLRPNANVIQIREQAERWVRDFLDPYKGGLDGDGWPFGGTLYGQDFARMVSEISEVRHVVSVGLFDMSAAEDRAGPGWEEGEGDDEIVLSGHDLFYVRRIRITSEENSR